MKYIKYMWVFCLAVVAVPFFNSCGGGAGQAVLGNSAFVFVSPVLNTFQDENNNFENWTIATSEQDLNASAGDLVLFGGNPTPEYDGTTWNFISGEYDGDQMSFILENASLVRTTMSGTVVLVDNDNRTRVRLNSSDPTRPVLVLSRDFVVSWHGVFRNVSNAAHFLDFYPRDGNAATPKSNQDSSGTLASISSPQSSGTISTESLNGVQGDVVTGSWLNGGRIDFTLRRPSGDITVTGRFTSVSSMELIINGSVQVFRRDCGNGINGSCIVTGPL